MTSSTFTQSSLLKVCKHGYKTEKESDFSYACNNCDQSAFEFNEARLVVVLAQLQAKVVLGILFKRVEVFNLCHNTVTEWTKVLTLVPCVVAYQQFCD